MGCWEFVRRGALAEAWFDAESDAVVLTSVLVEIGGESFQLRAKADAPGRVSAGYFPFPTQTLMTWRFALFAGVEPAEHDVSHIYELPFDPGQAIEISQGYRGSSTHVDEYEYALDFSMPVGSKIRAARAGIVALVVDASCGNVAGDGCQNVRIDIRHSDGTYASYQHLMPGSIRVSRGETVTVGDWLGLSGNSGNSGGPHLHFQVFAPTPDGIYVVRSVPTLFRATDGIRLVEEGRRYERPRITQANMTFRVDEPGDR